MSIEIDTTGRIWIDCRRSGLAVTQTAEGTRVYTPEDVGPYKIHQMPARVYALSCDRPASGNPGRADFERDIRSLIARQ